MSRKKIDFKERAIAVHGNKYDYSQSVYSGMHKKLTIVCPIHGKFEQEAHSHLKGQGCPKCGIESRSRKRSDTKETFIEKAKKVHGDKYDYSKVEYIGSQDKVSIICPEHGEFLVKPYLHIQGQGCPKCWEQRRKFNRLKTTDEFVEKAKEIHEGKYDYSKVEYVNNSAKVCIICPKHGEFWQTPDSHLCGRGCPKCGIEKTHILMSNNEFIEKARKVHGDKYDYSNVEYNGPFNNVRIICPKHGEFLQKPAIHLTGCGCQKCGVTESKWENEVYDFVHSLCVDAVNNDRSVLNGKEIDVFVPSKSIGFECDGLRWHNELHKDKNYHLDKTKLCNEKGIRLIHIFEDEWDEKKDIVKSRIRNLLGMTEKTIYARNCTITEVPGSEALNFMNENHLQGRVPSKYYYGLYYNSELVSLISFGFKRKNLGSTMKEGEFELLRFCNKKDTNVVGGASKLLKYFIKKENPREITSYCDLRWSDGSLYEKLGFTLDHVSQPNYFYVVGNRRKNRFNFRKDRLISEGYDANMTEHEIMLSRKIYRIYDCGCKCYIWKTQID